MAQRRPRSHFRRFLFGLICFLILLFLIAPALIVIPVSFGGETMSKFPPTQFSLNAYRRFVNAPGWMDTTLFSLTMSLVVASLAVPLAGLTVFGMKSLSANLKRFVSVLVYLPMMVPTIIFAISVYWFLARIELLDTFTGFVLVNLILALPYAITMVRAGAEGLDPALIRAAAVLGARPTRVILKVVLPLLLPALIGAALFAFLTAFDEVVVALFVSGSHAVPLSKQMWEGILFRWDPAISAISTIQIVGTTIALIIIGIFEVRRDKLENQVGVANRKEQK